MTVPIQLEGNIKAGLTTPSTSYASEIMKFVIHRSREVITAPATFANATTDPNAGAETDTLEVFFLQNELSASSWASQCYAAMDTDDATMVVSATLTASTSVSATNPKFSCTIVVASLDVGGEVGQLKTQTQTFPIKAGTLVMATSGTI